jgi:hypothetical protein
MGAMSELKNNGVFQIEVLYSVPELARQLHHLSLTLSVFLVANFSTSAERF